MAILRTCGHNGCQIKTLGALCIYHEEPAPAAQPLVLMVPATSGRSE